MAQFSVGGNTQGLQRFSFGKRQAWRQLVCLCQRFAAFGTQTLAGKQLGLYVMRFGAFRVKDQYLLHHGLGLVELARLRRIVDLVDAWLGLRHGWAAGHEHGSGQREADKK